MQSGAEPRWEHFPHVADMGVRGYGRSAAEAFEQAALGLTAVIIDPALVKARTPVAIECEAPDLEFLFFDWLNELLFLLDTERWLLARFDIALDEHSLRAECWGERIDEQRHELHGEVKAITYHQLKVVHQADGWLAEVILDI